MFEAARPFPEEGVDLRTPVGVGIRALGVERIHPEHPRAGKVVELESLHRILLVRLLLAKSCVSP